MALGCIGSALFAGTGVWQFQHPSSCLFLSLLQITSISSLSVQYEAGIKAKSAERHYYLKLKISFLLGTETAPDTLHSALHGHL